MTDTVVFLRQTDRYVEGLSPGMHADHDFHLHHQKSTTSELCQCF